jgi:hypothetical protein
MVGLRTHNSLSWRLLRGALLVLTVIAHAKLLPASELREVTDFADVVQPTNGFVKQYGPDKVLAVFDLDNTLLAMDDDLGSEQWFDWQTSLLATEPNSPQLVAKDFKGLLDAQGVIFDLCPSHPPQPNLPLLIGQIQGLGASTIVLTARGEEYRAATLYELRRNGYDFASHAVKVDKLKETADGRSSVVFKPYRLESLEESGLHQDDVVRCKLTPKPSDVSYGDGVFMVAGQHKGAMLTTLLQLSSQPFKAIVFVDQSRQVIRFFDMISKRGYDVAAFDYEREEPHVLRFEYADKGPVTNEWRQVKEAVESLGNHH